MRYHAQGITRRTVVGAGAVTLAGSALGATPGAEPESWGAMGPVHRVRAGVLETAYHVFGPPDGPPVLLLHGFPYDVHSYVEVAPQLAALGYRVIVPHLRGHGPTRFLSARTPRSGQQAALGADTLALMDALGIPKAILAGYDWGGRAACVVSALHPERSMGLVSVNGYLIQDITHARTPAPARVERGFWYQFYFTTNRGNQGLSAHRRDIARILWTDNSPLWKFDEPVFERSAAAFDNRDYVQVVVHSYRHRLGLAPGTPDYEGDEAKLAELPPIRVPSITLDGLADGVIAATDGSQSAAKFTAYRMHRQIAGVGHNLPQEAPEQFVRAIVEVAKRSG